MESIKEAMHQGYIHGVRTSLEIVELNKVYGETHDYLVKRLKKLISEAEKELDGKEG